MGKWTDNQNEAREERTRFGKHQLSSSQVLDPVSMGWLLKNLGPHTHARAGTDRAAKNSSVGQQPTTGAQRTLSHVKLAVVKGMSGEEEASIQHRCSSESGDNEAA